MKIIYQLGASWDKNQFELLTKINITITINKFSYITINKEQYSFIKREMDFSNVIEAVGTKFDKSDFEKANWFVLDGLWENGYPQPEKQFGYLQETYNLDNYCDKCGLGLKQNSSFKFKKEPDWKKHKMFFLTWVYDAIFVKSDYFMKHFKPFGVKSRPVMLLKNNKVCKTVVQLDLPKFHTKIDTTSLKFNICNKCGRKKYIPNLIGYFPKFNKIPDYNIFIGVNEFGPEGGLSYKKIFISKKLRIELLKDKINKFKKSSPVNW